MHAELYSEGHLCILSSMVRGELPVHAGLYGEGRGEEEVAVD